MILDKNLLILVDVDGVIAPMLEDGWLPLYNKDFDDNLTSEDITDWDLRQFVKPEARDSIYTYLSYPNLYDNVRPVLNSLERINDLKNGGHRIVYVTTGIFPAKVSWLYKYGFLDEEANPVNGEKDLVISADKKLVHGDVIVDDKPQTILEHPAELPILYDQLYNRKVDYTIRAKSWDDVFFEICWHFGL